jgi:hypothetical protein
VTLALDQSEKAIPAAFHACEGLSENIGALKVGTNVSNHDCRFGLMGPEPMVFDGNGFGSRRESWRIRGCGNNNRSLIIFKHCGNCRHIIDR